MDPLAEEVAAVVAAHQGCTEDAECTLVEPDLPCADLCARAVSDPEAVASALELIATSCPDCNVGSTCTVGAPFCSRTECAGCEGTCDTCRGETGAVGDGVVAGDGCWAPPAHRCSAVDTQAPPVLACPPAGVSGDCCTYDRGCLPCGWIDCDARPDDPRCLLATDGGTGRCPVVPYGTFCLDAERFGE